MVLTTYVTKEDVESLVISEIGDEIRWTNNALSKIYSLTAGHSLWITQLCKEAISTNSQSLESVNESDVQAVVTATLRSLESSLESLWNELTPAEKIAMAALSELSERGVGRLKLEQYQKQDKNVFLLPEDIKDALCVLKSDHLVCEKDDRFFIRAGLFRQWILQTHPLNAVHRCILQSNPVAESFFRAALDAFRESPDGSTHDVIDLLKKIIANYHPSHVRAHKLLSTIYINTGELESAVEVLENLRNHYPKAERSKLMKTLLLLLEKAATSKERLDLCERILAIESNQISVTKEYEKLWIEQGRDTLKKCKGKQDVSLLEFLKNSFHISSSVYIENLSEKAQKIDNLLRNRYLEICHEVLLKLDESEDYEKAWKLAESTHKIFPSSYENLPDVSLIRQKKKLPRLYGEAVDLLKRNEREAAKKALIEILNICPEYRESISYFYCAVKKEDIRKVQNFEDTRNQFLIQEEQNAQLKDTLARTQKELFDVKKTNQELQEKISSLERNA